LTLSARIIELLETNEDVTYSLTASEANGKPPALVERSAKQSLVKAVLLKSSENKIVQALVPSHHVIDLDAMFRQFNTQFEGISSHETWSLLKADELSGIPSVPNWRSMPTFVDESLKLSDDLILEAGDRKQLIHLSNDSFNKLIEKTQIGAFSNAAPKMDIHDSLDEENIFKSVKQFTQLRIRQRLDETLELPPLPDTAQRIIKLRADPNADISDLTNIVELDPSLAAQVVSWAASPYYSAPGKIKSVHDAIVRVLGFDMVLNLSLGLALGKSMASSILTQADINKYWRDAVFTAATVEGLVTSIKREHRPSFGMAYLSGLLNNFGMMIIAQIFPPYFERLQRSRLANPHLSADIVEAATIGVSGNQISSWLMNNWNMPEEVGTALRWQYQSEYDGDYNTYSKLIFVARQMLAQKGFGETLPQSFDLNLFDELHLDESMAESTIDNIIESGEDLEAIAEKMRS
jgi:HD-like signal output (HDOD) protein/prolyl-tRNA editing enzyme YbaK/EbsC (Cys-tRNA(Pro) deacylase)